MLRLGLCAFVASVACNAWSVAAMGEGSALRPPAVPLVVHDPYFSIWSPSNNLNESWPVHWTGNINAMCGMARIDGRNYRIVGAEPREAPPMEQVGLKVTPTRTTYEFEAPGIHLQLVFTTPTLPADLDLFSRPITYVTWTVRATDDREHTVALYLDATSELVVHEGSQQVAWSQPETAGLKVLRMGSTEQPVLQRSGDGTRIDWGYLYMAAPVQDGLLANIAGHGSVRSSFLKDGRLIEQPDARMPRAANDDYPTLACVFDLGKVSAQPVSRFLMLGYEDIFSIEFLGAKLRPYWQRNGASMADVLQAAAGQYAEICKRCAEFDAGLIADLTRVGGPKYADFCSLAYRQAMGAHKLVISADGRLMAFSKECYSGGFLGTVDVIYPAAPIFMLFSNELLKATVTPVFEYTLTDRWKFPFAPHDLGVYPKANGQCYGGGEKSEGGQMPVEESGNMLVMATVISMLDGNTSYVDRYWPLLSRWAAYLKDKGFDPAEQLCTDDFAGNLAHNANLSIKAIMALGGYAKMCEMRGQADEAAEYRKLVASFAQDWMKSAAEDDHYRLAFDRPNTWSQKYNLVWNRLLGLNIFPPEVAAKEIAYYKTRLDRFGLPLDNRATYTKTDWEVWTATLATNQADFDALMNPVYQFVQHTPQRVPITDWYHVPDAWQQGFQARPVIGGVFIKMLSDPPTWKKWSDMAKPH